MEIAKIDYINYARRLSVTGSLKQAFETYLMAFEAAPINKAKYEREFRTVLTKLNEISAMTGNIEAIFSNFALSSKVFPDNVHIVNEIGTFLFKYGFYMEAWGHFQKALTLDSGSVNAEKNLNSVKNLLVERWHFRMLNDTIRNEAYRKALGVTLNSKDRVLDIGTGTGLLALYAAEKSPVAITACDGSETMTKLASLVIYKNIKNHVQVLNSMSTALTSQEIGGLKTLVVTELFDAGLFGEHILPALAHAWDILLAKDRGRVIPNRAEFFIIGAQCDSLIKRYQLGQSSKRILNIPHLDVHTYAHDETYDCDDVHTYKDIKYMTDPQRLLDIDFNNYQDIQDKMICCDPFHVNLTCVEDGVLNIYIGYFKLYLTDDIVISTNPVLENRANAWQQAVFFDNTPQNVMKDQVISTSFLICDDRLTMLCSHNGQVLRASPEIIRFLNDQGLCNTIKACLPKVCECLTLLRPIKEANIVDLSPFPLFGFNMLKKGCKSLVCSAKCETDKHFIEQVFKNNNIPLSKITILTGDWDHDFFADETYDAIFCNFLELCGDVDMNLKELAENLRSNLVPGGIFLPSKVTLLGQLINCNWLDVNNRVYDENVSRYKIAEFMNTYQVSQNVCLDYGRLDFSPLSDVQELGDCAIEMSPEVLNIPVTNTGDCNAILCWYKIELIEDCEVLTNTPNSFIDCMAFLANPKVPVCKGNIGNILRCVDPDGSFKLILDVDV